MKTKGLLTLVVVLIFVTSSFTSKQTTTAPHIQFEKEVHDFGVIVRGGDGTFAFKFTNTGKEPLIITNVQSSCGCTVPQKPEAPILPGKSEIIKVSYNTNIIGAFSKYITVTSNADNASVSLTIKGEVKEKPAEEVPVRKSSGFTPVAK